MTWAFIIPSEATLDSFWPVAVLACSCQANRIGDVETERGWTPSMPRRWPIIQMSVVRLSSLPCRRVIWSLQWILALYTWRRDGRKHDIVFNGWAEIFVGSKSKTSSNKGHGWGGMTMSRFEKRGCGGKASRFIQALQTRHMTWLMSGEFCKDKVCLVRMTNNMHSMMAFKDS